MILYMFRETSLYSRKKHSALTFEEMAVYLGIATEKVGKNRKEDNAPQSKYSSGLFAFSLEKRLLPSPSIFFGQYFNYSYGSYVPGEKSNEASLSIEKGKVQAPPRNEEVAPGVFVPLHKIFPESCFPTADYGPSAIYIQKKPTMNSEDISPLKGYSERNRPENSYSVLPNLETTINISLGYKPKQKV